MAMKLQRTPLLLLLIALFLGSIVLIYETQGKPQQEAAEAKKDRLFSFKEEDVQTLNLTTQTLKLAFEKSPATEKSPVGSSNSDQKQAGKQGASLPKSETTVWMMTAPSKGLANDASIAYLLNLMATGTRQQTLTTPAAKLTEFGLDKPLATADVKLNNQQTHRIVLGKPNFDRSAIYAQVDPPAAPTGDVPLALVSIDFENAVTRPLSEWQSKESPKSEKKESEKK